MNTPVKLVCAPVWKRFLIYWSGGNGRGSHFPSGQRIHSLEEMINGVGHDQLSHPKQ